MSNFAPRRFGSYILTDILGEGGAGRVFQGYRSATDIKVPYAIKILLEKNLTSLRYLNQFREEALLASRLKHSNIGSFIEFFEFHGQNAIVLEFIEGVGLNRLILDGSDKSKRLELHHALFIGSQILEGLHYLQRNGVVHGDLSPGNVMIDREGQAKLIDFGLSKLQRDVDSPSSKLVQASLAYMSPQRLYQRKVTASDDLFAFGIILWELLTGERYHTDRSFKAICKTLESFTPRDPKSRVTDLPDDVARFVTSCLNAENENGYRSVADARDALRSVLARNSIFPDIDRFRSFMHERFGKDFQALESKTKEQGELSARASKDEATQVLTAADVNAPLDTQITAKTSSGEITQSSRSGPAIRPHPTKSVDIPRPPQRSPANLALAIASGALILLFVVFFVAQSRHSPDRSVAVAEKQPVARVVERVSGSKSLPKQVEERPVQHEVREVLISTSPPGAVVYRDQQLIGTTPFRMPAQARPGAFAFRKEGYGDFYLSVDKDIRSISVDLASGAYVAEKFQ